MLENLKFNFSFIELSETWATIMNQDVLNITNYNHEQCIRNKKRKCGGTSLYIHNSIQYKKREDLSLTKNIYESSFIEIDKTSCNTIIGEIYRPPSSNLKTFSMEIEKLLNKIKKEKKNAFLMGDYKTNTLSESNKTIKHVNEFSNIFASNYYHKLISLPTREINIRRH